MSDETSNLYSHRRVIRMTRTAYDGWQTIWFLEGGAMTLPPVEYTFKPGDMVTVYSPAAEFTYWTSWESISINGAPPIPYRALYGGGHD